MMIKTYCRQRPDLEDMRIPALIRGKETYITIDEWCYCEQPDELDNEEYNVKVAYKSETAYVPSIDLEFKNKEVKI